MNGPGIELDFIPWYVVDLWRFALWVGIVYVSGRMVKRSIENRPEPYSLKVGRIALFVLLVGEAVQDAERWGDPILLSGIPVTTVGLVLAWIATRQR